MQHKRVRFGQGAWGGFVGEGKGGQPIPLVILTVIVLSMAFLTGYETVFDTPNILKKNIPFKCVSCGNVVIYTIADLQKMQKSGPMIPVMGPMVMDCPKCNKKSLTQAVECPKCAEIFIIMLDPSKGVFNDKCPKCGVSLAQAWQDKYRKTKGQ